jgi:three-Cys-motif partner protein
MSTNESDTDASHSGTLVAAAEAEVNTVGRYLDGLTRWFARYPMARRTFVSLFSNTGMIRNPVARDLYKNACLASFEVGRPFDRYIFAAFQPQLLGELQLRYDHQFHSVASDVMFLTGDSNDLAHGIVGETTFQQELAGDRPAPMVVFLNPDELRLRWATLEILARLPHLFLIIFYPIDALDRLMPRNLTSTFTTEVDLFFGTPGWRDVYLRTPINTRQTTLLHYYQERIMGLGFREIVNGYDLGIHWERTSADPRLYSVLFAQKTPLPRSFWEDLVVNPALRSRGTGSLHTAPLTSLYHGTL